MSIDKWVPDHRERAILPVGVQPIPWSNPHDGLAPTSRPDLPSIEPEGDEDTKEQVRPLEDGTESSECHVRISFQKSHILHANPMPGMSIPVV